MLSPQKALGESEKQILEAARAEREALLSRDIEHKIRSLCNTILIDSSADPLYHVDIALGVNRRGLLIESLISEIQRLEAEDLMLEDD